ncbi:MAG: hypothetical protein ACTHJ3_16800 [Pararhizobium sp.]
MSIILDVVRELFGRFVADLRLTVGVLVLVGVVAWLADALALPSGLCGALLLLGSLAIVLEATLRQARLTRRKPRE